MPSQCVFNLNRDNGVYFAGEIVSGTVTLTTQKTKHIKKMYIKLFGRTKVRWKSSDDRYLPENYTSEIFLDKHMIVEDERVMEPDAYSYCFKFDTRSDFFTSCETEFGHVRYEICLIITKFSSYDNVFIRPLSFIKALNLNTDLFYNLPLEIESNHGKASCLCCLLRSSVYFSLKTPFYAYAPGQIIRFTLRMFNIDVQNIHNFYISFVRKTTYEGVEPEPAKKTKENVLAHIGNLRQRVVNNVVEDAIALPALPPTTVEPYYISIKYFLRARMDHVCCLKSVLEVEKEIVIGTLPVYASLPEHVMLGDNARQDSQESLNIVADELVAPPNLPRIEYAIVPSAYTIDGVQETFVDRELPSNYRADFRPLYPVFTSD